MKKHCFFLIAALFLLAVLNGCQQPQKADLIIYNAVIYTVDETFSTQEAMAITRGKIVELGSDNDILQKYQAKEVIDAMARPVFPGFYDAHSHFLGAARNKGELNLYGIESEEKMIEQVVDFSKTNSREWIVGRGWDQNIWEVKEFPTKRILDSIFPDTPVFLSRVDLHAALVNQAALDIAGIDKNTEIKGGIVIKNANNEPTGVLVDAAASHVSKHIPALSQELMLKFIKEFEQDCFQAGLTTVCDAGISVKDMKMLDSLHQAQFLDIGVYAMLEPSTETLEFMESGIYLTDNMTVRSIKLFSDGALGSRGAFLKEPYSDDPENSGVFLLTDSVLDLYLDYGYEYGFQICTHCIGDSANAYVLNKYGAKLEGLNDLRWRIEHAQVVSETDRHYFSDYAIIPSMQPIAAMSDMAWAEDRVGAHRISGGYALQSLKNELELIALGTDFPVDDYNPIRNFYAAVFRENTKGEPAGGYRMEEALTREDAIRGMTIWAAIAGFDEEKKGSLQPGKLADFIILDTDLIKANKEDILNTKVLSVFVAGKSVIEK